MGFGQQVLFRLDSNDVPKSFEWVLPLSQFGGIPVLVRVERFVSSLGLDEGTQHEIVEDLVGSGEIFPHYSNR